MGMVSERVLFKLKGINMKKYLLLTALLTSTVAFSPAFANDGTALSQKKKTIEEHRAYQYEFDRDEQCQGYAFGVKRLGITDACGKKEEVVVEEVVVVEEPVQILNEYVVYFDLNKATIRDADKDILNKAASEIVLYSPSDVLIAGYTDTKGSADYNEKLSAKRANAVSNYLNGLGVDNSVVDEAALGETNLAVPTEDGVKMQENRRVQIQFVR
jgi:outer membrane protein OmpA-like peptidoglycan-associated protein